MSRWLVLVLGLLAVILLNNVEDYLSRPAASSPAQDYDSIDYYMTDFSLSAITAEGGVSHTLDGQYLAYWHNKRSSYIIDPRIVSKDNANPQQPVDAASLTAGEAVMDHGEDNIELNGDVKLDIANNAESQLNLTTSFLRYQFADKHISTEQEVRIVGPGLVLQGTGLDSKLDEAYLRLNANVKSSYQPAH